MIEGAKAQQVQANVKAKVKAKVKAEAKPKAKVKAVAKPKVDANNGKSASPLYKKPAKANDGEKGSFHAMCLCDIKWHVCIN